MQRFGLYFVLQHLWMLIKFSRVIWSDNRCQTGEMQRERDRGQLLGKCVTSVQSNFCHLITQAIVSQWMKGSWHLEVVTYLDNVCLPKQLNTAEKSGQAAANQHQFSSVYHISTKGGVDKVRVSRMTEQSPLVIFLITWSIYLLTTHM